MFACSGLSLGTKFALLVAALIAVVVLFWGWAIASVTGSRLEEQIILKGADTLRAIALYGRVLLESKEVAGGTLRLAKDLELLATERTDLFDVVIKGRDADGIKVTYTMRADKEQYSLGLPEGIDMSLGDGIRVSRNFIVKDQRRDLPVIDISGYQIKGSNGAVIGTARVLINAKRVADVLEDLWFRMVGTGIIFLAIGVGASFFLGARIAKPAKILMEDMDRVAHGNYDHGTRAVSGDEIGRIAMQFNRMTKSLRELRNMEKEVERFNSELEAAKEIQASLLPKKIPQIPGYDIWAAYHSAKEVGGDYYDFFPIDRERLAVVVADVSGKGIPGSMVMASTRTILRIMGPECGSAGETLRRTNALVAKDIKRGMFVTAILAILNVRTRQMVVSSAGHNPMVIYRERRMECELVNPDGIALGFDEGPIFDRALGEHETVLEPGDRVVIYTDGVTEAMNAKNEEYGDERFYAFVKEHARMRSRDFVRALEKDLDAHKGSAEQHDDITIATLRVVS